jgi:hypothetical protein
MQHVPFTKPDQSMNIPSLFAEIDRLKAVLKSLRPLPEYTVRTLHEQQILDLAHTRGEYSNFVDLVAGLERERLEGYLRLVSRS